MDTSKEEKEQELIEKVRNMNNNYIKCIEVITDFGDFIIITLSLNRVHGGLLRQDFKTEIGNYTGPSSIEEATIWVCNDFNLGAKKYKILDIEPFRYNFKNYKIPLPKLRFRYDWDDCRFIEGSLQKEYRGFEIHFVKVKIPFNRKKLNTFKYKGSLSLLQKNELLISLYRDRDILESMRNLPETIGVDYNFKYDDEWMNFVLRNEKEIFSKTNWGDKSFKKL